MRDKCLIIGHRGSPGKPRFAENTLGSFDKALREGANGIELDMRQARCGTLVVRHDADLRTASGFGEVSDYTHAQLRKLDVGGGRRIPTLHEVIEKFQSSSFNFINIELKEAGLARRVAYIVERQRPTLWKSIVVSAFDKDDEDEAFGEMVP